MRLGKLTGKELKDYVLSNISRRRKEVIASAALGADCARIAPCGDILVHTDPITGEAVNIGSLAIEVSANDIIAGGGEPLAFLITLILPETSDISDVDRIMRDAEREAAAWDAEIVGGHTEFTDAVTRPVVNAVAIGKAVEGWKPHKPEVGDRVIVTKTLAIEGTVLLADMYSEKLGLGVSDLAELEIYRKSTGILPEGRALRLAGISCNMHDVTEGGIFGAAYELAHGYGIGIALDAEKIPFGSLSLKVCSALGADPYRLISSGSMLIIASDADAVLEALAAHGIKGTVVGSVTDGEGLTVRYPDGREEFTDISADELYRFKGEN